MLQYCCVVGNEPACLFWKGIQWRRCSCSSPFGVGPGREAQIVAEVSRGQLFRMAAAAHVICARRLACVTAFVPICGSGTRKILSKGGTEKETTGRKGEGGCVCVRVRLCACVDLRVPAAPVFVQPKCMCGVQSVALVQFIPVVHRCRRWHVFFFWLFRPCAFFSIFLVTRPRSFWLKTKKKKNQESQNRCWPSVRCHARNTCTLHLQTWLSGRRNFFTVIARRKNNFILLRSWMEVDDRVNVSNHYSKKHDARHSCTFAKALKTPQRPLARTRRKQASYTVQSLKTKSQDPFCWNHRT